MFILGISCYYHDSAAVLIKDGNLIAAAEEERFSRIKHDFSFPKKSIYFVLRKANITAQDLEYVVFYEKPFLKFERQFLEATATVPKSTAFFRESMKKWFFDQQWIKSHIVSQLKISPKKLLFSEHHLSHAAASFYPSPYKEAALLTVDGVGEWTTASWGVGNDREISLKEEVRYPHSLGLLYSAFTSFCGFEVNEGEYKLMGLAPYGKPKYIDKVKKVISVDVNGGFNLNLEYFSYRHSLSSIYTKKFEKEFGRPNKNSQKVIEYYADIAASVQDVVEEILVEMADYVQKKTKKDVLCFGGGVAYNSRANWKIINKTEFKHICIQPAAGDSGGALGAALFMYHAVLGKKRTFVMDHVYYGDETSESDTQKFLESENITFTKPKPEHLIDFIAEKIEKGSVVGWVDGRFEWGPRSLGRRSILADPRSLKMKDRVNEKIKFREAFRPFAPVTLAESGSKYFSVGPYGKEYPLSFMLFVTPVKEKYRENLGAITHVDGTARPQFIKKGINPSYYNLVKAFGERSGMPVLLNTSFNLKGEPIVNTPKEAMDTFMRSGLDLLVLNGFIIEKKKMLKKQKNFSRK